MTDGLPRPRFFNVKPAKRPTLGLVNQHETVKIQKQQENREVYDDVEYSVECRTPEALPAGVLPVIRKPRPERIANILSSPSKTPQYFRWKPKPMPNIMPGQSSLPTRRNGPSAPSPRIQRREIKMTLTSTSPERSPMRSLQDMNVLGSALLDVNDPESNGMAEDTLNDDDAPQGAWQEPSLFQYGDSMNPPTTPKTNNFLFDEVDTAPAYSVASGKRRMSQPRLSGSNIMDTQETLQHGCVLPAVAKPSREIPKITEEPSHFHSNPATPASSVNYSIAERILPQKNESVALQDESKSEVLCRVEDNNTFDSSFNELAAPVELTVSIHQQPPEKVIAQHVLRGKFLRKYLHASNITRKLRETEQSLNLPHASIATISSEAKRNRLVQKSFLKRDDVDETDQMNEFIPVLRRLSSIEESINKTVKRIRRLSGLDNANPPRQESFSSAPQSTPHPMTKLASLQSIGEAQILSKSLEEYAIMEFDFDENGGSSFGIPKADPHSAHLLRICQHVIAKRAIKSFIQQETSVIHQIEVGLRDDPSLQRGSSSDCSNQHTNGDDTHGAASSSDRVSKPIKAMEPELVEAVLGYLMEGDQHMTVDELYVAALNAETDKLWKRAILLASACIVIDREFVLVVLLRARCCRRLGLWAQAIQDVSHAVLLRPQEHTLFLLRAFLYAKTSDLENALTDVNRALMLHPKSVEALLLRADIFHRKKSIGASLQDLTSALSLDPNCWRAYYDRATIRIRAIEGDEQSLVYHWEHLKYDQLLATIITDYVNALRKGCKMVEVVETIGDLTVRLLEFTGDPNVLKQVIQNLSNLLQVLAFDHRGTFYSAGEANRSPGASSTLDRELLIAALHAQRGRLYVLYNDKANALVDFDHAVVMEYHYPVAHFYRGAFATLLTKDDDATKSNNMQHLTRCIALDPTIAGAYTVRGALYLRDLKFNNALQDFKAAVTTDPTLYEVWLQIALIYLNHYHDCNECIKACSNALTNDSCLARALYLRGEAYTRQGNTKAALRDYGRLTMAQPNDRWAQLMRGRILLQMHLARPALYNFISFMEHGAANGDKNSHLLCGRAFKILSRYKKAVQEFQQAVSLNPTSENLVLLSESLHSLGDTENSLRVSEQVISTDPGSFKGYVRRAQLLVSVGQLLLAMSEYDKALFLAPKEARVYYERGIVQMQLYLRWRSAFQLNCANQLGKKIPRSPFIPVISTVELELALGVDAMNDEALVKKMMKQYYAGSMADFSKSIRLQPLMADPYVDRAELFALGEDYDKAFRDFASALENNPKCVRAYINLGVLKCQFIAFASAIEDFDKAIKYDPKFALAFFNRAVSYQKLSLWSQAEQSYDKCISLFGKGRNIDAHRNRAITRCFLNAFDGALEDFTEVQQSAPDDDQLHGGLGYVLLQLGRYEDAAKCFANYGRLSRDTFVDSGNAYFSLGTKANQGAHLDQAARMYYLKTALRFYLRAVRLDPSNIDIRLNIANCLRMLDQPVRAITQCDAMFAANSFSYAALECKALALYQMDRLNNAIECMSLAIRTCVASSSSLANIFYAFGSHTIHRNALERKTITTRQSDTRDRNHVASGNLTSPPSTLTTGDGWPLFASAGGGEVTYKDQSDRQQISEIALNGSLKQILSLFMLNRGIMLEKIGDFEQARINYADAIHFDTMSVNAYICMGTLDLLEAKYAESIQEFTKALDIDGKSGIAHINIGVAYMCSNMVEMALTSFDAAIALLPTCSYGYSNKAVALVRLGDLAQAELNFKRAIEELPSRKEFYLARGKIIAQQKRLQDAMVDFSTALFLGYEGKL